VEGHNEGDITIASTSTEKPPSREGEEEEGNDTTAAASTTATADEQPFKRENKDEDAFDGKIQPGKQ
jgi:hypothetical protein